MGRIETVDTADCEDVLARVLAGPGRSGRAPKTRVKSFVDYMSTCALEWVAWRTLRDRRETALLLVLFIPGKTAIAMFPTPAARGIRPDDQQRLLVAGLERLADRGLYYVQALVEPEAAGRRNLLEGSGFRHLTQLIYLLHDDADPRLDSRENHDVTWVAYDQAHHGAFARMLPATYEDSRDCPELTGLRSIDDVIASHRSAGRFDPALWEIACVGGEHAGCILLSRIGRGSLLEVVYMGVVRGWRRRGVGGLLLCRALAHGEAVGARELTAVVDRRNTPARQLYAHFGFRPTAAREAYLYSW